MNYYQFEENFPIYTQFSLTNEKLNELNKLIYIKKLDFSNSEVLNTKTHLNEINDKIRKSKKAVVTDPDVYKWLTANPAKQLLKLHDRKYKFHIVQDKIDIIKYEDGDFFDPHQDFVKFYSNDLKCATLLICLKGDCHGGETRLFLNKENTLDIRETKTPGGCLMLRNELWHAGRKVVNGEKIILKVNLLITPYKIDGEIPTQKNFTLVNFKYDIRTCFVPNDVAVEFKPFVIDSEENKVVLDISYEQFEIICKNLSEPNNELISESTLELMRKMKIVTKSDLEIEKLLIRERQLESDRINDLCSGSKPIYFALNKDIYNELCTHLSANKNIIPVQYICIDDRIVGINVNNVPVYFKWESKCKPWYGCRLIGEQNINFIRRTMLFSHFKINDGDTSDDYSSLDDDFSKEEYATRDIYSCSSDKFIQAQIQYICNLTMADHDDDYHIKSDIVWDMHKISNKIDLYSIQNSIRNIVTKILNNDSDDTYYIPKLDYERIKPHINKIYAESYYCNESDYFMININVYHGFINIDENETNSSSS